MGYLGNLSNKNKSVAQAIIGSLITNVFPNQPFDLQNFYNKTFTVYNEAGALTSGVIEAAPDSTGPWATMTNIAGGTLGSATVFNYQVTNDTYKWWRIRAAISSQYGTVSAWITF